MSEAILQPVDIATERLRLRRFRRSDAALIELYGSDRRVAWMTERIPHPYPPGLAAGFVARVAAGAPDEIGWAIDTEAGTGDEVENGLIGTIMLRLDTPADAPGDAPVSGRVGYWLAPAFWGTGYATEALDGVVGFARAAGFRELTARVFQDNPASVKVLLHAGFAYVDDGEVYSLAREAMVPTHNYRLVL
jgi:RimJ/RimL family protein N-acetyltransferase